MKRIVPDIKSKHLDASRQFYVDVLGLEIAMDMGFIVTLVSPTNPTAQVSLMRDDGSSSILPQIGGSKIGSRAIVKMTAIFPLES